MPEPNKDRPKRVFISATTHDLKSYRKAVSQWARDKNYKPIVQDEFPTHSDYYTVRTLLRDKISLCDAVIHLAGHYYGAEPGGSITPENRRSYTQLEYDVSRALRKQIVTLIADEKYQPDNSIENQPEDLAQLQREHRERIEANKGMYYRFKDIPDLLALLADVVITDSIAKPNNLPAVGSLFKGREELLKKLRTKVERKVGSALVIVAQQTIHGLGGIGKTRLAIEYANRYSEHYNALLFVAAESPQSLRANIAKLCGVLRIDEPEPAKQYDAAIKWLQEHPGWFLMVDSVDTQGSAMSVKESILSKLKEGHVVVTSRLSGWTNEDLDAIELDVIGEGPSVELLLEGTNGRRKLSSSDQEDVRSLAKRLGYLPLALQQAVGFIVTRRCSFAEYLRRWERTENKVIEWHDELVLMYSRPLATTWETSFEEMKPDGRALLQIICWLAPEPIPKGLFDKVPQHPNSIDAEAGIEELEKYSFLQWVDDASDFVQVHGLVSEITRYRMSEQVSKDFVRKSLQMMNSFVAEHDPIDPRTWPPIYNPCRAHLGQLIERAYQMKIDHPTADLTAELGRYLHSIAEFEQAELLCRRALSVLEASYGTDHPNLVRVMNYLALLLQETNRECEAESLFRRVLAISETFYGPEHQGIVLSLSNLALLLQETNRNSEAEELFRRAIKIDEASLSPNLPELARMLNNLAFLLQETNRNGEAESLLRRAIAITEASICPDHPSVAIALCKLALLLMQTGALSEAEKLFFRARKILQSSHSPNYRIAPKMFTENQLFHGSSKRPNEKQLLFRRPLMIHEPSYKIDFPDSSTIFSHLAALHYQKNDLCEAEKLLRFALDVDEFTYGPDHPNVVRGLSNLAFLLRTTKRYREAETLYRRAFAIAEVSFSSDHPVLIFAQTNLEELQKEIECTREY